MDLALPYKFRRYIKYYRINDFLVITGIVIFNISLSISFATAVRTIFNENPANNSLIFNSLQEEFLIVVVGAPLLESFLYQYLIIEVCLFLSKKVFKKENKIISILIGACLFSYGHSYNLYYMISAFLGGLSLNVLYVYFRIKRKFPFLYVVLAHALYNLALFGLRRIG